jgi:glycosyltransferase involved in cell wall biosynthesis
MPVPPAITVMAKPAFRYRDTNPYCALLYEHVGRLGIRVVEFSLWRVLLGRYDVLHFHWPEMEVSDPSLLISCVRWMGLVAVLGWARLLGKKVVWTAHDLQSHELPHPRIDRAFRRVFLATLAGYFALSEDSRNLVRETYPALQQIRSFVTPHGHYRGEYPDTVSAESARAALGLGESARVFVHVGQIRPYKNVPTLIRAFRDTRSGGNALVVAGACADADLREELTTSASGDDRITLALRFVPPAEIQLYLRAADLIVLPYAEVLNSGSALLALSFDRPVLAPAHGSIPELARTAGASWIMTYERELDAETLEAAMDKARGIGAPEVVALRSRMESLGWPAIAERTAAAYRELLGVRADA